MKDMLRHIIALAEAAVVADTAIDGKELVSLVNDIDFAQYGSAGDRTYLAVLLNSLGLHEEAIRVLDLITGEDGGDGPVKAVLRNLQGVLLADNGQYVRAIKVFEEALDASSEDTSLRKKILANLATIDLRAGHITRAVDWINEAKATQTMTNEPSVDLLLASTEAELARLEGNLAHFRTAVSALAEASKSRIDQLDTERQQALTAVANLATTAFQLASEEDSPSRRQRSAEVLEVIASKIAVELGADHPQSLIATANFIMAEIETIMANREIQDLGTAIGSLESVSDRIDAVLGAHHPEALTVAQNLASVKLAWARVEAARSLFQGDPQAWLSLIVTALDERGVAAAGSVMAEWQNRAPVDAAWAAWVGDLIKLTAEGRLRPAVRRPLPIPPIGPFLGRVQQAAELDGFIERVAQGHGGLTLILGPAGIGKSRLIHEVLTDRRADIQVDWLTVDRGEAGYQGWRRLLAPLWITLRRTELAPTALLGHARTLDDILLGGSGDATGTYFPGEFVAAVTALLAHVAVRQPLVLVIDDAHRGGASSDHLLLDVARLLGSHGVGLIAALRPDELEEDSPLRAYCEQADGRAAADMVVPIGVPPLDLAATVGLLRERTGFELPVEEVKQVLRRTGGLPQLINSIEIQATASGPAAVSFAVGKLDDVGLRMLESDIDSRPEVTRTILQAAALCAVGAYIVPDVVAHITELPAELVERVLDEERQRGSILTPQISNYRFQHDNWIDALVLSCRPAQRRALQARCLALLRTDPASDPRQLARHALGAGSALVGAHDMVILAKEAADLAYKDYAFGAAAELYEAAARYAVGVERIDLLIMQSDALRFCGMWDEAVLALKQALSLARVLGVVGSETIALVRLERLTRSYDLDDEELTQQLRDVIDRLPPSDMVLRTQAQGALALRLSIATRQYENEQANLARAILQQLPAVTDSPARADIILGIRGGLQDSISPGELLELDTQILELGLKLRSAFHIGEALVSRIIDLIRGARLPELPSALRELREFAELSASPVTLCMQAIIDAMLSLARGDFEQATQRIADATALSEAWGGSVTHETLIAQTSWLLYETGQVQGLTEILSILPERSVTTLNEPFWALHAGLIAAERRDIELPIRLLREIAVNSGDFANLPRGPSRIGILATAAMLIGHPALRDALPHDEAIRWGGRIADLLTKHKDELVLAGSPAVMLGSKHRYIGLANLAAGQTARAITHLSRAAAENIDFAALHVRTRFDLARTLMRQRTTYSEGASEMERVQQVAVELAMEGLATQATAERSN